MAWTEYTSPAVDAVTGAIAPAALWNTYVRDNGRLMGPHLIVRKPSDEGPISSTTFQADNDLIAPVGANEVWLFLWVLRWVSASTANPKLRFTFPASAVAASMSLIDRDTAGAIAAFFQSTATSPMDPGIAFFAPTTGAQGWMLQPFTTMFVNGANAGNFALEWAPNAAANLTCKANSTLWGVKLA